jgi:hypothetical protein
VVRDPPRKSEQAIWPAAVRFFRQRVQPRRPRGCPTTCTERRCGHGRRRHYGIWIQRPQWERLCRLLIAESRPGSQEGMVGLSQHSTSTFLRHPGLSKRRDLQFMGKSKGLWPRFRLCRNLCSVSRDEVPIEVMKIGSWMDTYFADVVLQGRETSLWTALPWIGTHSLFRAATTGLETFIAHASLRIWRCLIVTTNTMKYGNRLSGRETARNEPLL